LANALGVPSSGKTGGVANGIIYLVLPGSADSFPSSQTDVDTAGAAFLAIWGGLDRVRESFSKITPAFQRPYFVLPSRAHKVFPKVVVSYRVASQSGGYASEP